MPYSGLLHPEAPQAWFPREPSSQWPPCQLPYIVTLAPPKPSDQIHVPDVDTEAQGGEVAC